MCELLGDRNSKLLKNVVEMKSEEDIEIVKLEYLYIKHVASRWGLNYGEHIKIKSHLSDSKFLYGRNMLPKIIMMCGSIMVEPLRGNLDTEVTISKLSWSCLIQQTIVV
jgi:hypothetical protein